MHASASVARTKNFSFFEFVVKFARVCVIVFPILYFICFVSLGLIDYSFYVRNVRFDIFRVFFNNFNFLKSPVIFWRVRLGSLSNLGRTRRLISASRPEVKVPVQTLGTLSCPPLTPIIQINRSVYSLQLRTLQNHLRSFSLKKGDILLLIYSSSRTMCYSGER